MKNYVDIPKKGLKRDVLSNLGNSINMKAVQMKSKKLFTAPSLDVSGITCLDENEAGEFSDSGDESPFSPKTTRQESNGYQDNLFEGCDDLLAPVIPFCTPRRVYSRMESFQSTPSPVKYNENTGLVTPIPAHLRRDCAQAGLEGLKMLMNSLDRCKIDRHEYFTGRPSIGKSSRLSTPRASLTNLDASMSDSFTPGPSSFSPRISDWADSPLTTPAGPILARLFSTPGSSPSNTLVTRGSKPLTPHFARFEDVPILPPEIKSTILRGVTCYVDVRTDKENCSEAVKVELLSMGAKVEKNFTRKVTHVVFKEGRLSVYLKAKSWNVPLVTVLWIEACKVTRSPVDPSLYVPKRMEDYENPESRLYAPRRKRRDNIIDEAVKKWNDICARMGKEKNGSEDEESTSVSRPRTRHAATDTKRCLAQKKSSQETLCTKQLRFNTEDPTATAAECSKVSLESSGTTTESDSFNVKDTQVRRKSAPAKLACKKRKRKKKEDEAPTKNPLLGFLRVSSASEAKRRKLFNPNESASSPSSQSVDENKEITASQPIECSRTHISSPVRKQNEAYSYDEIIANKTKTHSSSKSRTQGRDLTQKKSAQRKLMTIGEDLSDSRNSLTFFEISKPRLKVVRKPPTLVCTSLDKQDLIRVTTIVDRLGSFRIEPKVNDDTTHVVTIGPKRTVNLLKGLTRGCWILHIDWVYKSDEAGRWLGEEQFELTNFSPAVTQCRLERQAFGFEYSMDLFSSVGKIYVYRNCTPPRKDLQDLINKANGKIVYSINSASVVIGDCSSKLVPPHVLHVTEKWVLDSITQNTLLDSAPYLVPRTE